MRDTLRPSRGTLLALLVATFAASVPQRPVTAQDRTGTLIVRVRSSVDSTPLAGAFIRSGRVAATTDSAGVAELKLAGGLTRVVVARPGYLQWAFEITIVESAQQRVVANLDPIDPSPDSLALRFAGRSGLIADRAAGATVLSRRQLSQGAQIQPSGLGRVVDDVIAAEPQKLTGPLDATELRLLGLPGRYTGILIDGVPLFGAYPGTYRLVQLSPFEFEQAELFAGPMNAAFGPGGAGGVLNLVSRRADRDTAQVAVNQSSEKGGAVMAWGARRFKPTVGGSLFADFHQQRLVDADDDQWGEFPRAIRASIRPRLFLDRPNGDGLILQVGAMSEDRTGGFLLSPGDDDPYREELRTRRVDASLHGRRLTASGGRLDARIAAAGESGAHRFDDIIERVRRSLFYGDVTFSRPLRTGGGTLLGGIALQRDAGRYEDFEDFDYTSTVASVFGQVSVPLGGAASGSAAGRCDLHSEYGTHCSPRVTLHVRPAASVQASLAGGLGYFAPTPTTAMAEVLALRNLAPAEVDAEKLRFGSLDLEWSRDRVAIDVAAAYTSVSGPVMLAPAPGDSAGRLHQVNASDPLRVFSVSIGLTYRVEPLVARMFYRHQDGSESDPAGTGRRELALTPRHSLGLSLSWQGPAMGTWAHFTTRYVGRQTLWDNPYRPRTRSYTTADLSISQRMSRARLFVSGENLLDVRLRNFEPILLPVLGPGGSLTTTPWAPTRGRVISLGAVVEW